jgi:hypothetical protein
MKDRVETGWFLAGYLATCMILWAIGSLLMYWVLGWTELPRENRIFVATQTPIIVFVLLWAGVLVAQLRSKP